MTEATGLLGVLVNRVFPDRTKIFGEQTGFLRELCLQGKPGEVFVFGAASDRHPAGGLCGYCYTDRRWIKQDFPLPRVVYDRAIFDRQTFLSAEKMRRLFKQAGIPLFNPRTADKWRIYQLLFAGKIPGLPPTKRLRFPDDLFSFLARHPRVYIKPLLGSCGRSVCRVRIGPTGFELSGPGSQKYDGLDFPSLWQKISPLLKKGPCLMQREIDLLPYQGRMADIRVLVQKDGTGVWQYTGAAVRLAPPRGITTNLHTAGAVITLADYLQENFNGEQTAKEAEICAYSLAVAGVLDEKYGPLAELGLDLGMDRQGCVWFIEVNPRPGRAVFLRLGDHTGREVAVRRPLEFARFLAKGGGNGG